MFIYLACIIAMVITSTTALTASPKIHLQQRIALNTTIINENTALAQQQKHVLRGYFTKQKIKYLLAEPTSLSYHGNYLAYLDVDGINLYNTNNNSVYILPVLPPYKATALTITPDEQTLLIGLWNESTNTAMVAASTLNFSHQSVSPDQVDREETISSIIVNNEKEFSHGKITRIACTYNQHYLALEYINREGKNCVNLIHQDSSINQSTPFFSTGEKMLLTYFIADSIGIITYNTLVKIITSSRWNIRQLCTSSHPIIPNSCARFINSFTLLAVTENNFYSTPDDLHSPPCYSSALQIINNKTRLNSIFQMPRKYSSCIISGDDSHMALQHDHEIHIVQSYVSLPTDQLQIIIKLLTDETKNLDNLSSAEQAIWNQLPLQLRLYNEEHRNEGNTASSLQTI